MGLTKRVVLALMTAAACAGCSSGGSSGNGPTISSFTATPSSLPAGGGSVALAWSVSGATALSIDHSVGTVTPLTTGTQTVQVTATTTFTLTAVGSNGTSTSTAQVTVAAGPVVITVAGTVVDEAGSPASGETVTITSGTFSGSAVSDATGAFSISSVPTPYVATVLDSGGKVAVQYQGLTRTDPTLLDFIVAPTTRSATLSGAVTGGTYPQVSGDGLSTSMTFVSPQTNLQYSSVSVADDGTFSKILPWIGPANTTGTLYALQVHTVSLLPADYPGYGSLSNVLLQDMGTLAGQTVPLSSVTTGTVAGTFVPPAGYTMSAKDLLLIPATDFFLIAAQENNSSTSFSYTTPNVPNTSLTVLCEASDLAGDVTIFKKTGVSANASGLAFTLTAAPTLSLPVASATGVNLTTQFSWTNFTGVYLWFITPHVSGTGPSYYVFTAATTATIPDLSTVGLPLPSSVLYDWSIIGIGPTTSVDSVAVPGGLIGLEINGDGTFSETPSRQFTTSP